MVTWAGGQWNDTMVQRLFFLIVVFSIEQIWKRELGGHETA
jgi:hypothetical protein